MPVVLPTPIAGKSSGSSELALLGSGRAVLGGVESYFVYGDLVMNNRKLIDTYIVKDIDGLSDPDVRDSREPVPQDHGEHIFASWYGGRTIVLQGTIRAHNIGKLRDMQEALKDTFATLEERPLRIVSPFVTAPHHSLPGELEAPSVQINCKKSQPIQMRDIQNNYQFTRDFMLTLRASSPFFLSEFEEIYIDTTITSPHGFILTNKGNYRAKPKIVLTGPMTNPTFVNSTSNETLAIVGTIAVGNTWTIDIDKRMLYDQTGANKFANLSVASGWPALEPGNNTLTLTYTGGSAASAIQVIYRHTWI